MTAWTNHRAGGCSVGLRKSVVFSVVVLARDWRALMLEK